jgi:hypothetical protein
MLSLLSCGLINRRLALLPSALVVELLLRCQLGASIENGRCRLGAELNSAVSSEIVPGACRSHPNSAICFKSFQAAFFRSIRRLWFRNGSYTSPVTQSRCSRMPSFRATATTAFFFPRLPPL